jgi:GH35 family endo-1,4-beta-xylanase
MVKSLVSRKIPIDGVAFQLHSNLLPLPDYKAIAYRTKQFQDMGLEVQFSEIVVWNRQGIGSQAGIYRRFVQVGVDCGVELFGFWSPFDKYPWFAPTKFTPAGIGSPGLFDANFKIKSTGRAAFKTLI